MVDISKTETMAGQELPTHELIYSDSDTLTQLGRLPKGRKVIYTKETQITEENILEVVTEALSTHTYNQAEMRYLYNYKLGQQPILQRLKNVRDEINNRVVENHAKEAVDFFRGYIFGVPIIYAREGDTRGDVNLDGETDNPIIDDISTQIAKLNAVMKHYGKHNADQEMADWALTVGTGYRYTTSGEGEDTLLITSLSPLYTFVVYSNGIARKPLLGVHYTEDIDGSAKFYCYTDSQYFELTGNILAAEKIVGAPRDNVLGQTIVEYPLNHERMGVFEPALSELDAINTLQSNRLDGIEQFIQAYVVFLGVNIEQDDIDRFKASGVIALPPSDNSGGRPDMKTETAQLDQSQVQVLLDDLYTKALTVMGIPERSGKGISSGDTGQAVMFRNGWADAEARAEDIETVYKKSERQFLRTVLRILGSTSEIKDNVDLNLRDIDVKFARNKTDNLLVKVQALQTLIATGIDPETSFKTVNLFADPQQTYVNSTPYLERKREIEERLAENRQRNPVTSAHNKPDPTERTGE